MSDSICSAAFSRDNQSVFIGDWSGNIKMIKWKPNASSENDFDLTEKPKNVSDLNCSMCLTKDEKYLLVGAKDLLLIVETVTREVTKEFKVAGHVKKISLIQDGKKAILLGHNGHLYIIDLETMEIQKIAEQITNEKGFHSITVI